MYLRSLELNGFKSFAKKSNLEFSTSIAGIVGPNGSGKSNVAEAFRFVLGEQSLKSMRGKRGEDLIFNGSSALARANRASVKITLDNTKKQFPIDFDEVTIERVVYRDGVNEYLLNGNRTRLKDVQELLASANIGSTGHHIISQGEADRILTASPKERREMIEDALGLKVFQYKKAESERKLEKTNENIAQVQSLQREVQPHLKFLERQVKKIEKSLEVREQLKSEYREYLKREDEYIAFHHDRIAVAIKAPQEELASLEIELAKAKKVLEDSGKDAKRDALVTLDQNLRAVRTERQEAIRSVGKLEGQIAYLERRIAERAREQEKEERQPIPFARVEEVVAGIEDTARGGTTDAEPKALVHIIDHMVRTLRSFLNEMSRTGSVKHDTTDEDEHHDLAKEKKKVDGVLVDLDREEEKLRKEYDELKASIEAELSESRAAEHEVFRIMGREQELTQQITFLERERADLERDRNEFKRELEEAVSLIGRAVTEYFSYVIVATDGQPVTREQLVSEDRTVQLERRRSLEKMKIRLEELGAGAMDDVMKEYQEVKDRDLFLTREVEDLQKSVASLQTLITELSEELNARFVGGIEKIGAEFSVFFTLMFGGGTAALHRVKPKKGARKEKDDMESLLETDEAPPAGGEEEPLEEGIDIDVTLPNKRVRGLDMLSGGERALTSIALIFAMSQVNPPPFVILDETDAALDEANSKRYGDMIASLAQKSQLILITHNRETMSRAGILYGVTMSGDGVSKLLSVKLEEAVEVAK